MWGVGVGVDVVECECEGEGAGSCASTRTASRERGIGAAFGMWFEAAKAGTEASKGRRRNMGRAVMSIFWDVWFVLAGRSGVSNKSPRDARDGLQQIDE